ncbi:MAG: helix-turn-helix transcriptional regulator [Ruminococcaceae bacterium]|nr:helix-turn-helix transcriptional regulator [Oscillospiraceae bacterium]
MNDSKTVISIKEYGKIELRLNEILEEREIKRYHLAKITNTRFEVIDKWCKNNVEKLDLDVLARICYALDCSPSDIIKHIKSKE